MIPFIVDTTAPNQDGILASFDSPGQGQTNDFVFRDIQLAFYHRPVVPNGLGLWQDDWLDTDTFQVTVGDLDAQPTSGTFPIGVFAGTITANSIAASTEITTASPHLMVTGDYALIFGSNSTPNIDGLYQITKTGASTFTIPVTVTVAGTAGSVYDATGLNALAWNVAADTFQTALNTILTKHSLSNVAVNLLSAGQFNLVGTTNGAIPSLYSPIANSLVPQSSVAVTIVADGSASTAAQQIVELYQSPVAYSTPSTPLPVAALAVTTTQAGDSTHNKIFAITLTAGTYGGTMSISVTTLSPSAGTFGIIVSGGITATDLQTALVQQTNLANTDFNVTRVNDVISVEFAGTQGNSNAVALSAMNINLLAPLGVSGFINFNTFALFEAFAATTADELTYEFSIRRTRASGEQAEYFLVPVTLKRNLVQGVALIPVPMDVFFTQAQSDARYLRSNANSNLLAGSTLTINSGATFAIAIGGTLTVSGAIGGTATGGTLDLSAVTLANLVITKTTEQLRLRYNSTNYLATTVDSGGSVTYNTVGVGGEAYLWQQGGTTVMSVGSNALVVQGAFFGVFAPGDGSNFFPNRVKLGVDAGLDGGTGLGCAATGTATIISGGIERGRWTASLFTFGNPIQTTIGNTLQVTSGTNAKAGTFTLVAGVATVANTSVTANSVIQITLKTLGGTRVGNPDIVPTATTGFVATGAVGDTSTYNYLITEVA